MEQLPSVVVLAKKKGLSPLDQRVEDQNPVKNSPQDPPSVSQVLMRLIENKDGNVPVFIRILTKDNPENRVIRCSRINEESISGSVVHSKEDIFINVSDISPSIKVIPKIDLIEEKDK